MKAAIHTQIKEQFPDGSILSIVIWLLPEPTAERPHGYKYRLNYSAADGSCIVRYDNERGKGDHRHIGETQAPYVFESIEKVVKDFFADVRAKGGKL